MSDDSEHEALVDNMTEEERKQFQQYHSLENFIKLHKSQFVSMKFPERLWRVAYAKIYNQIFDILETFEVQYVEDHGFQLVVKGRETEESQTTPVDSNAEKIKVKAESDVWVVDHIWTTLPEQGVQTLTENEELRERLWKMLDMDRRYQLEREEEKEHAAARSNEAVAAEAAAEAQASAHEPSAEDIALVVQQASVTEDRARQALKHNKGDIINAINWCQGPVEGEEELNAQVERLAVSQAEAASSSLPANPDELTTEQRAEIAWRALFTYGLAGVYFTAKPRASPAAGRLSNDDVDSCIYVNDEVGSAIETVMNENQANAKLPHLVCVTMGGIGFSLLWLTQDVEEGEPVRIMERVVPKLKGMPAKF